MVKCWLQANHNLFNLQQAKLKSQKRFTTQSMNHCTIDEAYAVTDMPCISCQWPLIELKKKSTFIKCKHKNHLNMCHNLKEQVWNEAQFFSRAVTRDKSWGYSCYLEMKQASNQWKFTQTWKCDVSIIQYHFSLMWMRSCTRQIMNYQFYLEVLRTLHENIWRKWTNNRD